MKSPSGFMNPYLAGIGIGLVILVSFLVLGTGAGAYGGLARVAAYLTGSASEESLARHYLVVMLLGIFLGAFVSALVGRRIRLTLERGQACSARRRALSALAGGILAGFAARLAEGCTFSQAVSGGALLLSGSLAFLASLLAGGFAAARLFRRQWHD